MTTPNIIFQPIISNIQKIAMYETKNHYYLIGSINTQRRFRVIKIDRNEPKELLVYDDKVDYTIDEIHDIVKTIELGNRSRYGQRAGSLTGCSKIISGFGIVGFIRFLEGYYIILVTKRRIVASVGLHTIYKIEDTCMIYIPNETVRIVHQDEPRYVKMFQNIDLSSNFYYSYSYDLTHTLQHNMSPPRYVCPNYLQNPQKLSTHIEDCTNISSLDWILPENRKITDETTEIYGIRHKPHRKFVWNEYLLKNIEFDLHPDWIIYVIHGFIGQYNMSVFGRSIYITLIARRSNKYAGTRFLKRGSNFDGDVANEVETEQMVHDSGVSSFSQGRFSSFVQMRGSIPAHWSQDITRMVAKPIISIDLNDPYCETAGAHINELFKRYGTPLVILNLVKTKEKKKHESFLSEEMSVGVSYLNQFLPPKHHIQYIGFDMARMNKSREAIVMGKLADVAYGAVKKIGIFVNHPPYFTQSGETIIGKQDQPLTQGRLQMGIIRTNCVDCLDRTNTAQFAIGKCVLGFQLCALGILDSPKLEFDSDCVRMLENLYEDHGDTLALQYGGSQLVHRIKTYRKTAPWTSQGNDIMNTLSRYYSNTFSDAEKQNTINLFLGLFVPREHSPPIWEYLTDYYLHHPQAVQHVSNSRRPKTQWWDPIVLKTLPKPYNDVHRVCTEIVRIHNRDAEMIDAFIDYYRLDEMTFFDDAFAYKMSNSVRDFMPNFTLDFSPFTPRVRPGRRREETFNKGTMKNPSVTGQSSQTSDTSSSEDSGPEFGDDETNGNATESQNSSSKNSCPTFTYESLFPSMRQVYGMEPEYPKRSDILLYKRYVLQGQKANTTVSSLDGQYQIKSKLFPTYQIPNDSIYQVQIPVVTHESINIYQDYIEKRKYGGISCKSDDYLLYTKYSQNKLLE